MHNQLLRNTIISTRPQGSGGVSSLYVHMPSINDYTTKVVSITWSELQALSDIDFSEPIDRGLHESDHEAYSRMVMTRVELYLVTNLKASGLPV